MDEYDVIVLGTGAAGLTAAIAPTTSGARVAIFEKADKVGGTTAWSGGMVWIPLQPPHGRAGDPDSREDVLTYLRSLSHGLIDEDSSRRSSTHGPEAVTLPRGARPRRGSRSSRTSPTTTRSNPGAARGGGRSLEYPLFAFADLGDWQRPGHGRRPQLSGNILMSETSLGRGAPGGVPAEEMAAPRGAADERGAGQGLVGALLKGCLDRGIEPLHRRTAPSSWSWRRPGHRRRPRAADRTTAVARPRRCVLATGGFEWDHELVSAFLRGPLERPVVGPDQHRRRPADGDAVGAALGNMREAWWVPIIDVPTARRRASPAGRSTASARARTCIMVNRKGRRFANEAANYNAIGAAFHVLDVTDVRLRQPPGVDGLRPPLPRALRVGGHRGEPPTPDWMIEAPSARRAGRAGIGVPAEAFAATVARWNEGAPRGEDPDFGRGEALHDRWWGDATARRRPPPVPRTARQRRRSTPCEVYSGALGTKGGPRTDADGPGPRRRRHPIGGLYAAGNVMAIGDGHDLRRRRRHPRPGLVFGYAAGQHAAAAAKTA